MLQPTLKLASTKLYKEGNHEGVPLALETKREANRQTELLWIVAPTENIRGSHARQKV